MAPSAAGVAAAAMPLAAFDQALLSINSNPYFIGSMMLMMNLGGRFLSMEMTPGQEKIFHNPWVRRFLIFIVIFMGTRNVLVAFWMTVIIVLCIGYLFNENSSLCIFHLGRPDSSCMSDSSKQSFEKNPGQPPYGPTGGATPVQLGSQIQPSLQFSPEEAEIFKRLSEKNLRIAAQNRQASTSGSSAAESVGSSGPLSSSNLFEKSAHDVYMENMMLLRNVEGFKSSMSGVARF
jgi:hypothetical protein